MKTLAAILLFASLCFAGYKTDSLWVTKYFNWNSSQIHIVYNRVQLDSAVSKLSSKGGTIVVVDTVRLTSDYIISSNIELCFSGRGCITGAYTLTIGKLGYVPMHQIFDTSLTVSLPVGSVDEVRPEWFGAIGDSVTDDTKAIRRTFEACGSYGQPKIIKFLPKFYRITKPIFVSEFTSSWRNGSLTWAGETRYWGGNQARYIDGLLIEGTSSYFRDSVKQAKIWADFAGNWPMFVFAGATRNIQMKNIMLDGKGVSYYASEGVFLTAGGEGFKMTMCHILNCIRPFRMGNNVHWATDPDTLTRFECDTAYPTTTGGWQVENIVTDMCTFSTPNPSTTGEESCITIESAQAINVTHNHAFMRSYGKYCVYVQAGRQTFNQPAFLVDSTADIYVSSSSGTNAVRVYGGHSESGSGVSFWQARSGSLTGTEYIYSFKDFNGGSYKCYGSMALDIQGGTATNVYFYNTESTQNQLLTMNGVVVSGYVGSVNTTNANKVVSDIKNCRFTVAAASPFSTYFYKHHRNILENNVYLNSTDSSTTCLNHIAQQISSNPTEQSAQSMWGTYYYNMNGIGGIQNQLNLFQNAFRKNDTLYASVATGGYAIIDNNNFGYRTFAGQTGWTPISVTSQLFKITGTASDTTTSTGKLLIGRILSKDTTNSTSIGTGCATFAGGIGIGGNTTTSGKIKFTDSTKCPVIKDASGKYWRIKVGITGTLTADSTGQN